MTNRPMRGASPAMSACAKSQGAASEHRSDEGVRSGASPAMSARAKSHVTAIRIRRRTLVTILLATLLGLVAFLWPFVVAPGQFATSTTPALMFALVLLLVLAVVFAEIAEGGIDSKALAMLGVLSAINAALRP